MDGGDDFSKAWPRKCVSVSIICLLTIISNLDMLFVYSLVGCGECSVVSGKGSLGLSGGDMTQTLALLTWPVDSWQERNSGVHGSLPSVEVRRRAEFHSDCR